MATRVVEAGRERGIDVQLSDDYMLDCLRLNGIKNAFLRRRIVELWALAVCLSSMRKYREFNRVIFRACRSAPGSWAYRVKLARVALKKIGIHEILRRRSTARQWILLDNEGIVQASHTLFVHSAGAHYSGDLAAFLAAMPLSDAVVYLRQPETLLLDRTRQRGHNRIPHGAAGADVASFIGRAVQVFETVCRCPKLADRLLVIDGERNRLLLSDSQTNPLALSTAGIVLQGLAKLLPDVVGFCEDDAADGGRSWKAASHLHNHSVLQ
ncbi:MAG: hypothetical protein ACU837_07910 [Gammaproteobacteria bacterium]